MADNFNPLDTQVIPSALATTKKGDIKALTPLQNKVENVGTTVAPDVVAAPLPSKVKPRTPAQVAAQQMELNQLADGNTATPFADAAGQSFGGYVRDIYRVTTQEEGAKEVDPNYDRGAGRRAFRETYGQEHWDAYEQTRNQSQQDVLIKRLQAKQKRDTVMGASLSGTLVGSIFDPIGILTGGTVLKGAVMAARSYKLSKNVALTGGAVTEAGIYAGIEAGVQGAEFGEVYDPMAVAQTFAIAGALHFGVGKVLTPKSAYAPVVPKERIEPHFGVPELDAEVNTMGDTMIASGRRELADFAQAKADELGDGKALDVNPERSFPPSAYPDFAANDALVDAGSAVNKTQQALDDNIIKSESFDIQYAQEAATIEMKANTDVVGAEAFTWLDSAVGRVASTFSNTLQALGSKSPIVQSIGLRLGADPTGRFRAIEMPTAYDKKRYNNQMRDHYSRVHTEYGAWLSRNGLGGKVSQFTGKYEVEFNKKLRAETEARWNTKDEPIEVQQQLDEARWKASDPEIKRAADALDEAGQVALDLMKKHNVLGAEGLGDVSRGYVPRRMNGKALQELHRLDPKKYEQLSKALGRRYFESFTATQKALIAAGNTDVKLISLEKAQTIARGTMERAINRAAGVDGSTIGLFDRAARDEIRQILEAANMDFHDIEYTFKLLDKKLGGTTGSNRLKGRMDVDISTPDEATGIDFLDYYDNDLHRLTHSYAEEMSGRIALARQGITSDNDIENIVNAIMNENKSANPAKDIQLVRDMYAVMLGRPLEGQGQNKAYQFLTQWNPIQTLGQVGAAQATESSLSVARLGLGTMLKTIPIAARILVGARKGLLSETDLKLLKDIEAWNGPVGEQWRTHRPSSDVMERLNSDGEIAHMADRLLKGGQQLNGYLSFMHQIMETQLKVVAIQGSRTFAKEIKAGVLTKRIADAGFTDTSMKSIKKNLDAHAVFENGELVDMQMSKWDMNSADEFTRNIERLSGQLIQQDYAGETASWMQKDMGRMLLSLRGYGVKAFNKQLVRNLSIRDAVAAQSVAYGFFFSAMGYTAKQHAVAQFREDKDEFLEDRLSGDALIQGAVGYMALGSFGPELLRPLASWAGEGSGESGAIRSGGNAVVAAIPGLAPIDRALTLIGNVGGSVVGEQTWTSARTRQAAQTVLGNSWPVAIGLNAAIEDDD